MALHIEMGSNDEGLLDAVVIYQGSLTDLNFPLKLSHTIKHLKVLCERCDSLAIKKVEPWNSVRVTLSLPPAAAQRLRHLAQQGDNSLRELGILSVQLEGDQVISLTASGEYTERHQGLPNSSINERTNSMSSLTSSTGELFGSNGVQFRSPNVVVPQSAPIPFLPRNSPVGPNFGPFPFSSMTHAAHNIQNLYSNHVPTSEPSTERNKSSLLVNLLQADANSGSAIATKTCSPTLSTGALEIQSDKMSRVTSSPHQLGLTWRSNPPSSCNSLSASERTRILNCWNSTFMSANPNSRNKLSENSTQDDFKQMRNTSVPRCLSSTISSSPYLLDGIKDMLCYAGTSKMPAPSATVQSVNTSPQTSSSANEFSFPSHAPSASSVAECISEPSHSGESVTQERQFLINPVTGELESASSVSSEENEAEAGKLSPLELNFSDSEGEVRLANHAVKSPTVWQPAGETEASAMGSDKLKLKLKLSPSGKVDLKSESLPSSRVLNKPVVGVPRLRISLKGPNAAVLIESNESVMQNTVTGSDKEELVTNKNVHVEEHVPEKTVDTTSTVPVEQLELHDSESKKSGMIPVKRQSSWEVPEKSRETIKFGNVLELEEKIRRKSASESSLDFGKDSATGSKERIRKERSSSRERKKLPAVKSIPVGITLKKTSRKSPLVKKLKLPFPQDKSHLASLANTNGLNIYRTGCHLISDKQIPSTPPDQVVALLHGTKENSRSESGTWHSANSTQVNEIQNPQSELPPLETRTSQPSPAPPVKGELTPHSIQGEDSGIESMDTQSEKSPNQDEKDLPDGCACKNNQPTSERTVVSDASSGSSFIKEDHHANSNPNSVAVAFGALVSDCIALKSLPTRSAIDSVHSAVPDTSKSETVTSNVNNSSLVLTTGAKVVPVKVVAVQSSQSSAYRPLTTESSRVIPSTMTILSSSSSPVKVYVSTVTPSTSVLTTSTTTANLLVFKSCVTSTSGESLETTEKVISLPEGLSISRINQPLLPSVHSTEMCSSFSLPSPDPQPVHRVPPKYTYANVDKLRDSVSPYPFEDDSEQSNQVDSKSGSSIACDHNYVTKAKPSQGVNLESSCEVTRDFYQPSSSIDKNIENDCTQNLVNHFPNTDLSTQSNGIYENLTRSYNCNEVSSTMRTVKPTKRASADSIVVPVKKSFQHGFKEAG